MRVVLGPKIVQSLKEKDVVKAGDALVGKTIRVKGKVWKEPDAPGMKGLPRIDVKEPTDFQVVEKK